MKKIYIVLLLIFSNCYFNPLVNGLLNPDEKDSGMETFLALLGLNSSGGNANSTSGETVEFSARLLDSARQPISNAIIDVETTSLDSQRSLTEFDRNTQTDQEGNFSLTLINGDFTLNISNNNRNPIGRIRIVIEVGRGRVVSSTDGLDLDNISVESSGGSPSITFANNELIFSTNEPVSVIAPTITGTPFTNCVISPTLPEGLSINATSCAISGTPITTQSATNYTVTASNSIGTGTTEISITINSSGVAPTISFSGSPFTFTQNSSITTITPTFGGNTPTSCTSSPTLPSGLNINATSCAISGTPSGTQTATNYTITASNSFGSNTASISIAISAAGVAPTVSYSGSPFTFTQNSTITTITPTLGGNIPTSCISSPTLPTGLSINTTSCNISGTPTIAQSAINYTITASNSFGSESYQISISVIALPKVATPTISPTPGFYDSPQNIAMTTTTSGAKIYFTLDGSNPTSSSYEYASPIHIFQLTGRRIKMIAIKNEMRDSEIVDLDVPYRFPEISTGQTSCFSQTGSVISCSNSGQDGEYRKGMSLSITNPSTLNGYTNDYVSIDTNNGLTWKTCIEGRTGANCSSGTALLMNWNVANDRCHSLNSVNSGNGYAGIKNWRIPTIREIKTTINYGTNNSAKTVLNAFPNTLTVNEYWANETSRNSSISWVVGYNFGGIASYDKTTIQGHVRCVSAISYPEYLSFTDNLDGSIRDNRTGLLWKKCFMGKSGNDCSQGTMSYVDWSSALSYCNNLNDNGKKWRLPNIKEIHGLVDNTKTSSPVFNMDIFPDQTISYWTSTSSNIGASHAWRVTGIVASTGTANKSETYSVRCVTD